MLSFWNRSIELSEIKNHLGKGHFAYITGRRRVGKTALLVQSCQLFDGFYHQAVEGTPQQQLVHLSEEMGLRFPLLRNVVPKTWNEFFHLLSQEKLPPLLVFDEFPYWVQGDPTLPSILQKWVDHELPKLKTSVIVSGSSQSMLYGQFLHPSAPLYGRISYHRHLLSMSYLWFCKALKYSSRSPLSFERFSLVGGIPHYWRMIPKGTLIHQMEELYFKPSALLAEEPIALLRDEGVTGSLPKALLDLIGRGVTKPSELAGRVGTAHGNLSRPLALLMELGLIHRELPFGESSRTTKKVIYSVQDPALDFYFGSYLPHRAPWFHLKPKEKMDILHQHASHQWEHFCRLAHPGSARYWEGDVEIDLVAPLKRKGHYLVAECKWTNLSPSKEQYLLQTLKEKFEKTRLKHTLKSVEFRVFSQKDLEKVADYQDNR